MDAPVSAVNSLADVIRRDPLSAAQRIIDGERALQQRDTEHAQLTAERTELSEKLLQMQHELAMALLRIQKYEEEQRLARAQRFGASSEASPQYALFDEAEFASQDVAEPCSPGETTTVPAHERRRPRRQPLPANLPRHVIEHPPAATHCDCGAELVRIGTKTSEQLDVIPRQVFVIEHRRGTFKCPCCVDAVPATAPMPTQLLPKSLVSAGLVAHVANAKFTEGMPLYRQSVGFARDGIDLPRQTLARAIVQAGERVLPLVDWMTAHALQYDVLQMDETHVQVLKERGRAASSDSWMWVLRGGPAHAPVIRFHYDPRRSGEVAKRLLADYHGYLQTDAHAAYHAVHQSTRVIGLGCWAHVRRKFIDVQKALPKGASTPLLDQILHWIGKLYGLERELRALRPDERKALRKQRAVPILKAIETWLARQHPPPNSLIGKAIGYLRGEWPRLQVYLEDGRLAIDNNGVENAIRPFALGRRSWLFSDTPAGADASAALYSLVETAKANGLNPYAYLKLVFTRLPEPNVDLDDLLPWRVDRNALDRMLLAPM